MRIAVSGSHGSGKSTLIEAFLRRHGEFAHEPEPYVILQEVYGETFAETPTFEDFERQLELNIEALRRYKVGDHVIFERSSFDFLAYMLAVADREHRRRRSQDVDDWVDIVRSTVPLLDAVVFLPLDRAVRIELAESEDLLLREAVDELLHDILVADEFNLFVGGRPILIEARGSVEQRLLAVERILR